MGLRSSCRTCQHITNGMAFAFKQMGFCLLNYIDDMAGAAQPLVGPKASEAPSDLLISLGLAESVDKVGIPSTGMICLGIHFDTVEGSLTVTPDKLADIKQILLQSLEKDKPSRKEVQSIIGSLNFSAAFMSSCLVC